jgi:hypothetical protein
VPGPVDGSPAEGGVATWTKAEMWRSTKRPRGGKSRPPGSRPRRPPRPRVCLTRATVAVISAASFRRWSACHRGAALFDSATSVAMIRGGRVDAASSGGGVGTQWRSVRGHAASRARSVRADCLPCRTLCPWR